MSRLKKKESSGGSGSPAWMTTFSDLVTLLLTFFILLYTMSTVDADKFREISYSLQAALMEIGQPSIFQGEGGNMPIPITEDTGVDVDTELEPAVGETLMIYEKVRNYITEEELNAQVSVNRNKRGVFVDIKEAILFESGSAEIKDSGMDILKRLEGLLNGFDNEIVIEGHTDNVPISRTMYPSNWELSTARAVSVVRYLSEVEKIDPGRLSALGYGEYRPIVPNSSSENRANNRRVNILIIIEESENEDGSGDN